MFRRTYPPLLLSLLVLSGGVLWGGVLAEEPPDSGGVGDPVLGAYLAGECLTCHQLGGSDHPVPSIVNWAEADFVAVMDSYRRQIRPHPVMQMVAGRLSDEEIAALAAFFATVDVD